MSTDQKEVYVSLYETKLGWGGVIGSTVGLKEVLLPFAGQTAKEVTAVLAASYPGIVGENQLTQLAASALSRYFAGETVAFDYHLDLEGVSDFYREVYAAVTRIPVGQVRTYGEVAAGIGRPRAARGVGQAMAANPLPIIIPCHRVIGSNGSMTGYSGSGGVVSKKWLLEMEGVPLTTKGRVDGGVKK